MRQSELNVNISDLIGPRLDRLQQTAVIMAVIGLVLCAVGFATDRQGFFPSYLAAYMLWFGATLGSLALLMLHHVVGGGWGFIIRRFIEAGSRLLPLMLVLFIPVFIGLVGFGLYEWATPEGLRDPVIQTKHAYLNIPVFVIQTLIFYAIWIGYATFLNRNVAVLDQRDDPQLEARMSVVSAGGLVVYSLTATFTSVLWVMSLTPRWYSSIFGMLFIVSQALTTMAVMLVLLGRLAGDIPIVEEAPKGYFRDLGNLMLAFLMLWAYMSFSQYLLTFTGNLAEESTWYVRRATGGWQYVSLALIPLHFALPFLVLLVGSGIKRDARRLAGIAAFILVMRIVDVYWWVVPTFREGPYPTLLPLISDVGAFLLIGGIWLWFWAGQVKGRPIVPIHDPRIEGNWPLIEEVHHG